MKRLSELDSKSLLIVGEQTNVMTKEEFLNSNTEGGVVHIAEEDTPVFSLAKIIDNNFDDEGYEGWSEDIIDDLGREMIKEINERIQAIFNGRPVYCRGERIIID